MGFCAAIGCFSRKKRRPFYRNQKKKRKKKGNSNDPKNANNISLALIPIDLGHWNVNFGLWGQYTYNNQISISAAWSKNLFNTLYTVPGNRIAQEYDLTFSYFFISRLFRADEYLFQSSQSSGALRTDYYVKIPAQRLRLVGLRGGMEYRIDIVSYPKEGLKVYTVDDPSKKISFIEYDDYPFLYQRNVYFIGISRSSVSHISQNLGRHGIRKRKVRRDYFFDILCVPSIKFYDAYTPVYDWGHNLTELKLTKIDPVKTNPLGFRIGVHKYSQRVLGVYANFEFGSMASYDFAYKHSFYARFKFGYIFGAKAGK